MTVFAQAHDALVERGPRGVRDHFSHFKMARGPRPTPRDAKAPVT
jgi:hypothetical protein